MTGDAREDQAAVRAELERFFTVSHDLLCHFGFDGRLRRANPAWERILGYGPKDLDDARFLDLVHEEDRPRTGAELGRLLGGAAVVELECRCRAKDGAYRWFLWSAAADVDREMVYASAKDLTERHRLEESLRHQATELEAQGEALRIQQRELESKAVEVERASRMKSEFLANMSHELRTPLNAIIGFSELLLEDARATLSKTHHKYVGDIRASGAHLLGLINDILDLVKIEAGRVTLNLEHLDPQEAVLAAVALTRPAAQRKAIEVRVEVATERAVRADRQKLQQILLNLLANAVKFSPDASIIEVRIDDQGELVRFAVRDHGPGMEASLMERLFQPFVQGEDPLVKHHQGTGLGLAISKRLVERHCGTIGVASAPGAGSTFSFTIPRGARALTGRSSRPQPEAEARPEPNAGGKRPLVLVVEDDPASANLLRSWLQEAGYDVVEASGAADALSLAERHRPAAILLDLVLDARSGPGVLDELKRREATRAIPVLVTTVADERDVAAARGATDYSRKPLARAELLERLAELTAPKADATSADATAAPSILVADDHDLNRELVRTILERKGYRVFTAEDGEVAVEVALRERPALILMDLSMPRKDGFAATRELKEDPRTKAIPILALTALAMPSDEERVGKAGFDGYLTKPIDRAALEGTVAAMVGKATPG